nr:cystinosin-like isoform X1 [Cherax quadricarinatus]
MLGKQGWSKTALLRADAGLILLLLLLLIASPMSSAGFQSVTEGNASLTISPHEVDLTVGDVYTFNLTFSEEFTGCVIVTFNLTKDVGDLPLSLELCDGSPGDWWPLNLTTTNNGKATLTAEAFPKGLVETRATEAFALVSVMTNPNINVASNVLGWIYTIAWDISFLPQIIHIWRRRSVEGFSFDFITFNFIGFFSYFIFNMGLYWIHAIKEEYFIRHPSSVLHVRLNDVIFPLYALLCTAIEIVQCFFYHRAPGQRVSTPCMVISGVLVLSAVVGCVLVPTVDSLLWLDLLYWLSYIKLIITCIKYIPQLYENYRRQSTSGWNIWQVILDFIGGTFSLLQMFLLAGNYDDWRSVLADPTKLGLGLLSIFFDTLFIIQHYCLYKNVDERKKSTTSLELVIKDADNALSDTDVTLHL